MDFGENIIQKKSSNRKEKLKKIILAKDITSLIKTMQEESMSFTNYSLLSGWLVV